MSSQLPRGIHVADATTMMQKYSLLPGATLVALLSLDCAAGSGSQDSPFSASSVDGGTGASSSSGGSSGSGTSGGSGGSSGGQGLNPVPTGDDAGASASDDATTGDDGSFTVTGTGEGDASTTASGHHSGNGGSSSGGNTGSSSGGNTGSSSGGTVGTNTGGAMPTVTDGDGGKSYATLPYRGLAMSGAEFGASVGGLFNGTTLGSMPGDYYYPTTDLSKGGPTWPAASKGTEIETDLMDPYYLGKGMNTIRFPLRWERLQHSLSSTSSTTLTASQVVATFDANELAALEKSVSTLTAAGFTVLIDIHNYASYTSASEIASSQGGDQLGSANAPNVAFENLWIGLASLYANDPKVVFDIMNEPNTPKDPAGEPAGYEWYLAAQAAVTGIRGVGANNLILICGNDFAGPGDFTAGGWSDPLKAITDPSNNFAFEVHDYPDTAFGSTDTCTTTSVQSVMTDLQTFVTWAQKYKMRGFLGEFSAGIDTSAQSTCETAISQMLTFLGQNSSIFLGWTYWAAGAGFGSSEPMNYPLFNSDKDSPQMTTLEPFLQ
jgi:endoglucanase